MLKRQDVLKDKECPPELEDNLTELLIKINKVEDVWGKPLTITSGLRSKVDQIRIYAQKGIIDLDKIPMGSKHFFCLAVDISDPNGEFRDWILKNMKLMEEIGIWFEDFKKTRGWVHMQIRPPKSGNRVFSP